MSEIGDRSKFSIEWQIVEKTGHWIIGHLCFWTFNQQIGDYDDRMLIDDAYFNMKNFLSHKADRHLAILDDKPKEEIYAYLYATVIPNHRTPNYKEMVERIAGQNITSIEHNWALHNWLRDVFHLDYIGLTSFEWLGIVLFDDYIRKRQRLIWFDRHTNILSEVELPENEFDVIGQKFVLQYESEIQPILDENPI
jgi:hypothetical protein